MAAWLGLTKPGRPFLAEADIKPKGARSGGDAEADLAVQHADVPMDDSAIQSGYKTTRLHFVEIDNSMG
jgi:hypothetical protein